MGDLTILAAGRRVPDGLEHIRRYCGLRWANGGPETWGWRYYDRVPPLLHDHVSPADVTCAAAIHPGITRRDLAWFAHHDEALADWLAGVPRRTRHWDLSGPELAWLMEMPHWFPDLNLRLVSKVLHRKRPELIPLIDRHTEAWYGLGSAAPAAAMWASLLQQVHEDESDEELRAVTAIALVSIQRELDRRRWTSGSVLSSVRARDIAIWMAMN